MTAIRQSGKINANTTLIDNGLFGVEGAGAVYLIEAGETLLVDCGTQTEAPRIVQILRELNSFPPDKVVFTHSHDDHCQGIHYIRKEARKEQKDIRVMASSKAIPLLEDQSWQKASKAKDIRDVNPIKEDEVVDLGGLTLRIIEVPGHSKDHIAIFDEKNKNLFVGDSLGYKLGDKAYIPPFMPPYWDTEAFYNSVKKLSRIDYKGISMAHFGFIYGKEAENILNEAVTTFENWWKIYEYAEEHGKLEDYNYLAETIKKESKIVFPEFKPLKSSLKFLLGIASIRRRLAGKKPYTAGEIFLRTYAVKWLAAGYKTYRKI